MPTGNDTLTEREVVHFHVLRALSANPEISQRQIAQRTGVSLGSVNYSLRSLAEKGFLKVQNFRASDNKLRYAYVLTPRGISAKGWLTIKFLRYKLEEYDRLRQQIEEIIDENTKDGN